MFLVIERGDGAGLDEGIDIERLTNFFHGGNQLRMGDAVAETEPRETVNFGKRAHEQKVLPFLVANERDEVGRIVEEINVGLVHHQQHRIGYGAGEFQV
jgi:hypothetical protein